MYCVELFILLITFNLHLYHTAKVSLLTCNISRFSLHYAKTLQLADAKILGLNLSSYKQPKTKKKLSSKINC